MEWVPNRKKCLKCLIYQRFYVVKKPHKIGRADFVPTIFCSLYTPQI